MNLLFLLNKEIKYIFYHYKYFFLFYLFYLLLICLFIFNIGPNSKIISYLGINIINFNIILTSILSSSYFFIFYKKNGILELYTLSLLKFEYFLYIKAFLYWFCIMIPLCFFTLFNLFLFNILNFDILLVLFSYFILTLIILFTNIILSILTINIQYDNIIIFIFNVIINIPIILLINSLINTNIVNISLYVISLLIYLLFIILIYPFICSIIHYYIIK
jgi:heme exporter protein CcmB